MKYIFRFLAFNCTAVLFFCTSAISQPAVSFNDYWKTGSAEVNIYTANINNSDSITSILVYTNENGPVETLPKAGAINVLTLRRLDHTISNNMVQETIITPTEQALFPATVYAEYRFISGNDTLITSYAWSDKKLLYATLSDSIDLNPVYTEEDLWNRIRINPQTLPLGKIDIIPSLHYLQLSSSPPAAQLAESQLNLQINADGSEWYSYTLSYPESGRLLKFIVQSTVPYTIKSYTIASTANGQKTSTEHVLLRNYTVPARLLSPLTSEHLWNTLSTTNNRDK